MPDPILEIKRLNAWYGESQALSGMSFSVRRGELVTLLGLNGAGKTTTLRALMGLVPRREGSVLFDGVETIDEAPYRIGRLGLAYCPEERGIFSTLSVEENLLLPPVVGSGGMSLEDIFSLFPNLRERLRSPGTKLSGGEQQMLSIARILRTGARVLMLDEPTEGLAPVIVQQIAATLRELKKRGFTVLLVEQNFRFALKLADRHHVVAHGQIVAEMGAEEALAHPDRLEAHLGV